MLEMSQVQQVYSGQCVLDIPRFRVEARDRLVLFGPNGAGKSTLLRLLALVEKPTHGQIFYQGVPVKSKNSLDIRRRFVLLLQRPVFFHGSVRTNVIYGLKVRRLADPTIQTRLDRVVSLFSLEKLLDRRVDQLSGGEAQRVNLARAFILQPEILFLDEPFSPLDAPTRQELLEELRRTVLVTGQTTVLVTHHREEVLFFGERVAVLIDGNIQQEGPVEEVFSRPTSHDVARLVGVETILAGRVVACRGQRVEVNVGEHTFLLPGPAPCNQQVLLCIRPEDVILAKARPEGNVPNWFFGTIVDVCPTGRTLELVLDCGFQLKAAVTRGTFVELGLEQGGKVWAGVKETSVHLIPSHTAPCSSQTYLDPKIKGLL